MSAFSILLEKITADHLEPWADRAEGAAAPPPAPVYGPVSALPAQGAGPEQLVPARGPLKRRRASKSHPDIPMAALEMDPASSMLILVIDESDSVRKTCTVRPYNDSYGRTEHVFRTVFQFIFRKKEIHLWGM